jgi:hypothetical protein
MLKFRFRSPDNWFHNKRRRLMRLNMKPCLLQYISFAEKVRRKKNIHFYVGFAMEVVIFWDTAPCSPYKNQRFVGKH